LTNSYNYFKAGVFTKMRIGVLTGGGDCPGLNAVIRAVVRKGVKEYGYEFIGFKDGWRGPLEGLTMKLDIPATRGILPRGGTILGSSRTNPLKMVLRKLKRI
jgi:6-phosphofructokinase